MLSFNKTILAILFGVCTAFSTAKADETCIADPKSTMFCSINNDKEELFEFDRQSVECERCTEISSLGIFLCENCKCTGKESMAESC